MRAADNLSLLGKAFQGGGRNRGCRPEFALASAAESSHQDHASDPQDLSKLSAFAAAHHLAVVEANAAQRSVVLSGTAASLGSAFGVTLQQYEHDGGSYRGRTGSISVPDELAGIVEGVFGLDHRPQATPHFQCADATHADEHPPGLPRRDHHRHP